VRRRPDVVRRPGGQREIGGDGQAIARRVADGLHGLQLRRMQVNVDRAQERDGGLAVGAPVEVEDVVAVDQRRDHQQPRRLRIGALAVIAVSSALWPAGRAARLTPVEALSYER